MKKQKIFLISLLLSLIYIGTETVQQTVVLKVSLLNSIYYFFHNSQKISTALILFLSLFLILLFSSNTTDKNSSEEEQNIKDELQHIIHIIFAPTSLHIISNKLSGFLTEKLNLSACMIFMYNKEDITLINNDLFAKQHLNSTKILPFKENLNPSSLEGIISKCFLEKSDFDKSICHSMDGEKTIYSFSIKQDEGKKPLGVISVIAKNTDYLEKNMEFLKSVVNIFGMGFWLNLKTGSLPLHNTIKNRMNLSEKQLGIYTPVKLQEFINSEIKRFQRYNTEFSIMIFEIDYLENLKNIFSEEIINIIKNEFVNIIKNHIRDTDILGQYTNDQCIIMSPNTGFRSMQKFANRLILNLKEYKFKHVGKISCSFGITSYAKDDTIGSFRKRCELALQNAKKKGPGQIEVKLHI